MVKLDLACGNKLKPGFIGVDVAPGPTVGIVWDLNQFPWPFDDDSVDEISCCHYIEHCDSIVDFMEELYRIMKPGATGEIRAPFWSHSNTWRDPTHKRGIADTTLFYFDQEWCGRNNFQQYNFKADFAVGYSFLLDPRWQGKLPGEVNFAVNNYINVVMDVIFTIRKK